MVKQILFDFDGTLVDSIDLLVQIGNYMAEKYRIPQLSREEFMQLNTLTVKERMKKLQIPFYLLPKITIDIMSKYKTFAGTLKISEEIKELLNQLKAVGLEIIIVSSNSSGNIEKCLNANGIDIIDSIYSTKGGMDKSALLGRLIKERGFQREEIIYVGDELRDINSCKTAGVKIIAVTWGYDPIELLNQGNPEYIAEKPSDILEILALKD